MEHKYAGAISSCMYAGMGFVTKLLNTKLVLTRVLRATV